MANHKGMIDLEAAKASAREAALTRKTCEGCVLLRQYPRPMCSGEKSPHFRTARDTYHERCQWYAVRGQDGKPVVPQAEPHPVAASAPNAELRLLQARNRARRVSP